jgi:hypothetical protein
VRRPRTTAPNALDFAADRAASVPSADTSAQLNDRYERWLSTAVTTNVQFVLAAARQIAMTADSRDQHGRRDHRPDLPRTRSRCDGVARRCRPSPLSGRWRMESGLAQLQRAGGGLMRCSNVLISVACLMS